MSQWSPRRWYAAILSGLGIGFLIALPTAVIPNPIFGRAIETTWWSYPTVVFSAILGGLLIATYVRESVTDPEVPVKSTDKSLRLGTLGGLISFFAVGCPVCNKLVLLALGSSGAISWFAPIQPFLAVISLLFMLWALNVRLINQDSCAAVPVSGIQT
ncbi:MAG: hypothetical protein K0U30_00895 [Actinomycetia bacterium]|nr:hypothetical protein [Actinomycetes bacterium]